MQQQETQSFLDFFRDRLTNPALFTYFWVLGVFHWKLIGWFLFEPLEFSSKLQRYKSLGFEINFINPLFITILVIIFSPLMNNAVEFIKRAWDQAFSRFLKKINWKELVDAEDYNNLLNTNESLRNDKRGIQDRLDTQTDKIKQNESKLLLSTDKVTELETQIKNLEEQYTLLQKEKSDLLQKLEESIKVRENTLTEMEESQKSHQQVLAELEKSKNNLLKDNQKLKSQLSSLINDTKNNEIKIIPTQKSDEAIAEVDSNLPIKGISINGQYISATDGVSSLLYPKEIKLDKNQIYKIHLDIDFENMNDGDSLIYYDGHKANILTKETDTVELPFDLDTQTISLVIKSESIFGNKIDKQTFLVKFSAVKES